MKQTRLDLFNPGKGLDRGRPKIVELMWYLVKRCFFLTSFPWPNGIQLILLRLFGAKVGKGINIKPRVNIHLPWNLTIGDYVWIGEEVFLLNFESISIGSHSCISQRTFVCTGNHDFREEDFRYRNAPITIGSGVWIGAQCFVGPGIKIGNECVTTAGSIVVSDLPENQICSGNPCKPVKTRWK